MIIYSLIQAIKWKKKKLWWQCDVPLWKRVRRNYIELFRKIFKKKKKNDFDFDGEDILI